MKEKKIIDTGSGISPLGPSNKVKASIRRAIKEIKYVPDGPIKNLERFFMSKFGLPYDRILFANSVSELACAIIRTFRPGRVLVLGPALRLYEEAASRAGAEVLYFDTDEGSGFAADTDKLISSLDGSELIFVANPNRITGKLLSDATLARISNAASEKNVFLVIDESLAEFTGEYIFNPAALVQENVITIKTTAFFYCLPGLELAYAVSGPSTIRSLRTGRDWSLNTLSVAAAKTALKDETYRKHIHRFIADEKELLLREMEKVGGLICFKTDSNVYLVKLENFAERLMKVFLGAGFLIRDCGDISGLGKSFLRLSVMSHDKNLKLLRLMKELVRPSGSSS